MKLSSPDSDRTSLSEDTDRLAVLKLIGCGVIIGAPWLYPPLAALELVGLIIWFRLIASRNRSTLCVLADGALIGFVSLGIAFHWARESIHETTHATGALSYLVWSGLVFWEAIPFALISLVVYRTAGRWTMFGVPFVWGLFELYWPRIFPWSFAHVFLEWLPLMQTAQLGGQALVTAVVMWTVIGIVLLWLKLEGSRRTAEDPPPGTAYAPSLRAVALVTILPVVAALVYGSVVLGFDRGSERQAPEIQIAALQVDPTYVGAIERLGELSDDLPADVELVCWPESTLGFFADDLQSFTDMVEVIQHAKQPCYNPDPWPGIRCDLLAGAKTFRQESEGGPYRNVAYLINNQKKILDRYIKRDLMPIGEYVPGEQWFPVLREWAALDDVLDRGKTPVSLQLSSGPNVGVMICYEDMVADNAVESVRNGAQLLVALINASQFPSQYTLLQHERLARLRAVETQRWMLRCGATGRTCLIAPSGKVVDALPLETTDVLLGRVKIRDDLTLYSRYPGWFAGVCVLASVVVVGAGRRTRRSVETSGNDT